MENLQPMLRKARTKSAALTRLEMVPVSVISKQILLVPTPYSEIC